MCLFFVVIHFLHKSVFFSHLPPLSPLQLLDISELDMVGAGREAKRRRKTLGNYIFPPSVKFHSYIIEEKCGIILTFI